MNIFGARGVDVCHGVQIKIEQPIKGHELRGIRVVRGELGHEVVFQNSNAEPQHRYDAADDKDYQH